MSKDYLPWIVALLFLPCLSCFAAEKQADPDRTLMVLKALFESADQVIPTGSSCSGTYGNQGPAKVADLLAMQLAYFYRGKNVIKGACRGTGNTQCSLRISHSSEKTSRPQSSISI